MTSEEWSTIKIEIGRRVRQEREAMRLSLHELSARARIPVATLQRIERGTTSASLRQVYQLGDALGCAATELMDR